MITLGIGSLNLQLVQTSNWLAILAGFFASAGPLIGKVTDIDSADGSLSGGSGLGVGWLGGWGAGIGQRANHGNRVAGLDGRWSDTRLNVAFERREIISGVQIASDRVDLRQDVDGFSWALSVGYRY